MAVAHRLELGEYCGSSLRRRQTDRFVVTENSFEAGLAIAPHEHVYAHFTAVLDGSFSEQYSNINLECPAGSILIVPPGQVHTDEVGGNGALTLGVELSKKLLSSLNDATDLMKSPRVFSGAAIARKIERLYCDFRSIDAAALFSLEATALEILAHCARSQPRSEPSEPGWFAAAMAALHSDPSVGSSLSHLATLVGVHEAHLARTFRRIQGCSVGEYVRWLRLEAAKKLLSNTELGIAEIALQSGFYDQAHFSRAFKSSYGVSPSSYRMQSR